MPKIKDRHERWEYFGLLGGISMAKSNMGKILANRHAKTAAKTKASQILDQLDELQTLIKDK